MNNQGNSYLVPTAEHWFRFRHFLFHTLSYNLQKYLKQPGIRCMIQHRCRNISIANTNHVLTTKKEAWDCLNISPFFKNMSILSSTRNTRHCFVRGYNSCIRSHRGNVIPIQLFQSLIDLGRLCGSLYRGQLHNPKALDMLFYSHGIALSQAQRIPLIFHQLTNSPFSYLQCSLF